MCANSRYYLDLAARLAMRGVGCVEPNPMVGCVIAREHQLLGLGHHQRYGDLHAERQALLDCRRRGNDPRGATAYVTLEPCCHHGKQPPCTDALIEAGISRVVYARNDPHELSRGGVRVLEEAGIVCERCRDSSLATHLSDPFIKRVRTGLPWVIAKWAQTAAGQLTTPAGQSPWISNRYSLRRVHRLRSRVDAIITGIGTVQADDPLLTARNVPRVRRRALRVVLDSRFRIDPSSKLIQSASAKQRVLIVGCDSERCRELAAHLDSPAIRCQCVAAEGNQPDLQAVLNMLATTWGVSNVMLECGPTLLERFLSVRLVDEALVYVAADTHNQSYDLAFANHFDRLEHLRSKPLAGDTELWFRRRLLDEPL